MIPRWTKGERKAANQTALALASSFVCSPKEAGLKTMTNQRKQPNESMNTDLDQVDVFPRGEGF
jgi:hypothetical protein